MISKESSAITKFAQDDKTDTGKVKGGRRETQRRKKKKGFKKRPCVIIWNGLEERDCG